MLSQPCDQEMLNEFIRLQIADFIESKWPSVQSPLNIIPPGEYFFKRIIYSSAQDDKYLLNEAFKASTRFEIKNYRF